MKRVLLSIPYLFGIIIIFTGIDYCFHQLSPEYAAVPPRYFPNKVLYGTLFGVILFWITIRVKRLWLRSLIIASVIAVLLQVRYFFEGYPLDFVILFLFIHWGILWCVSWLAFKYVKF